MLNKKLTFWQFGLLVGLVLDVLHFDLLLLVGRFPILFHPLGDLAYSILDPLSLSGILILPIIGSYFNFALYGMVIGKIFDPSNKKKKMSEKVNKILGWILASLVVVGAILYFWAQAQFQS